MGWLIALLVLVLVYLFLIAPRIIGKPNRMPLYGVHYAHRGLFDNETYAPENSIAAIQKAVEAGYGIEFDVQLSKDNVPVVFHDASLKRMCGVEGKVWEYTVEELQKLKLGKSNETIPTFAHVLEIIDGRVPLIIEYKMDRVNTKVCELGNALLEKYNYDYKKEFKNYVITDFINCYSNCKTPNPCIECNRYMKFGVMYEIAKKLGCNYIATGHYAKTEYKGIQYWLMKNLLTNFVTRPDFIAYKHSDYENLSRRICRTLGALSVAWTVRSEEQYQKAKPYFDLFIFDSFIL